MPGDAFQFLVNVFIIRLRSAFIYGYRRLETAFDQRQGVDFAFGNVDRLRLFDRVKVPQARLGVFLLRHIFVGIAVFDVDQFAVFVIRERHTERFFPCPGQIMPAGKDFRFLESRGGNSAFPEISKNILVNVQQFFRLTRLRLAVDFFDCAVKLGFAVAAAAPSAVVAMPHSGFAVHRQTRIGFLLPCCRTLRAERLPVAGKEIGKIDPVIAEAFHQTTPLMAFVPSLKVISSKTSSQSLVPTGFRHFLPCASS